jgi:hypothetical protein
MAHADFLAELDVIHPHQVLSDEFWKMHFQHACEHWALGSSMYFDVTASHPRDPAAIRLVSRAKRKDGGEEERLLHHYTKEGLSFTRRMKEPGESEFTDTTTLLPHSKKALQAHLASMPRCNGSCSNPCAVHLPSPTSDCDLKYVFIDGNLTVGPKSLRDTPYRVVEQSVVPAQTDL